jgi:hypothetical protein
MSPDGLRCYWQVTAGLIPGEVDPVHSRYWSLTSAELRARPELFTDYRAECDEHARQLQLAAAQGGAVNWVRTEFYWL